MATARSLKKKQQQLQADQDLLNDRWTNVLAAKEYDLEHLTKVTRNANCYPNSMMRRWSPSYQRIMWLTIHHTAGAKRQFKPNTILRYLAKKTKTQQLRDIPMTYDMT